jgi:Family of unknown function (DUF6069)
MPILTVSTKTQQRRIRLLAIVGGVVVAEVLWAVAELGFGLHLQAPASNDYPPMDLCPVFVGVTAAVLSLVGWVVLAVLERLTSHARVVWLLLAPFALLASLAMPLGGTGVSDANRAVLVLMHIGVAAALIPAFYRTLPRRARQPSRPGLSARRGVTL